MPELEEEAECLRTGRGRWRWVEVGRKLKSSAEIGRAGRAWRDAERGRQWEWEIARRAERWGEGPGARERWIEVVRGRGRCAEVVRGEHR